MAPKQEDILIHRFLFPGDHPNRTVNYSKGSKLTLAVKKIGDIRQEVRGYYMYEAYRIDINSYGSFCCVSISSCLHNSETMQRRYDHTTFGTNAFLATKEAVVHFLRWYLLRNDGIIDIPE